MSAGDLAFPPPLPPSNSFISSLNLDHVAIRAASHREKLKQLRHLFLVSSEPQSSSVLSTDSSYASVIQEDNPVSFRIRLLCAPSFDSESAFQNGAQSVSTRQDSSSSEKNDVSSHNSSSLAFTACATGADAPSSLDAILSVASADTSQMHYANNLTCPPCTNPTTRPMHLGKTQSPSQHQIASRTNDLGSNKVVFSCAANWPTNTNEVYRLAPDCAQFTWQSCTSEQTQLPNKDDEVMKSRRPSIGTDAEVVHANVVRDRSCESWIFRPKDLPSNVHLERPECKQVMDYSDNELEYSDGPEEDARNGETKRDSLDRKLIKMDETIRDFTSHLSQIDSTLGQMRSFGSIGQYLDNISKGDTAIEEVSRRLPLPPASPLPKPKSSSSSSGQSGKSYECYPSADGEVPMAVSPRPRRSVTSSSLGTSLTTLPSSLWSSVSPAHRDGTKRFATSTKRPSIAHHLRSPGGFRLAADVGSCSSSTTDLPSPLRSSSMIQRSGNHTKTDHPSPGNLNKESSGSITESDAWSSESFRPRRSSYVGGGTRQRHMSSPNLPIVGRHPRLPFAGHRDSVPIMQKRQNFYPSSDSSSSPAARRSDSVDRLSRRLFHLMRTGREMEARQLIESMLSDSSSRAQLADLIASLSTRAIYATRSENLYENTRSNSLLRLAESLAALADQNQYRSRTSLTGSSRPRTPASEYARSTPSSFLRNRIRPHRGSGVSLSSSRSIHFVEWPPDAPMEERLPPMKPKPRPHPPSLPKSTILPPVDVLKRLDTRASEIASTDIVFFSNLVSTLTEDLTDEVCITRILFSWIASMDLRVREFDSNAPPDSLLGTLRRIQNGQLMYNELMQKLCRFAGIQCQFITGYTKGLGYRPGMPLKNNQLFHSSWLAVHVGGGWRFLNVDMALRSPIKENKPTFNGSGSDTVDSGSSTMNRFCDEFYFLTDPEQHIFISFPDQKAWQLLNKPIAMDRFIRLPLLRSAFFNANLSLKKNYGDCLVTSNGQLTLKLSMPQFVSISCSLENSSDHSILRGLCLVEVLQSADIVRIQVSPSQPGKYYLHIFVASDWRHEDLRQLACSFRVHCSEHNYERLVVMGRLPEIGFLGPTPETSKFGISMHSRSRSGRSFFVHTSLEPFKLQFAIPPGLKICHQLKSFDRPGHQMVDCDSYALLQMRAPSKSARSPSTPNAFYIIRMPVEGFYYLTVYASANSELESDHLECVYRILIDVRRAPSPNTVQAFPRQTYWWVHCFLHEPLVQRLKVNQIYHFRLDAPHCDSVAVVLNENDWVFLTRGDSCQWSGKVNVGGYLGQVSVFGRFRSAIEDFLPSGAEESEDSNSYVKLLDYVVVE